MNNITPSIASDIELLVKFVDSMGFLGNPALEEALIPYKRAAERVEIFLSTYTPNHLDDKTLEH